jgi:hypothetical protein
MPTPAVPIGAAVTGLAPYVHVADVERSLAFYAHFGLVRQGTHAEGGRTVWGSMRNGQAHIMFAQADPPVEAGLQGVLFYLYSKDVRALRKHLVACGLRDSSVPPRPGAEERGVVFPVQSPFYMPAGELRVHDPDGYCLLVGQLE